MRHDSFSCILTAKQAAFCSILTVVWIVLRALSQLSIRGQDNPTLARSVSPLKFDQKLLMAPPPFPCEHRVCGMARCLRNDLELRSDENLSGHTQTHTLALVSRVCTPPNHACADKRSIFCQIKKHSVRPGPAHAHTQSSRC